MTSPTWMVQHIALRYGVPLASALLLAFLAIPIGYFQRHGLAPETGELTRLYFESLWRDPGRWLAAYRRWLLSAESFIPYLPFATLLLGLPVAVLTRDRNSGLYGKAAFADHRAVRATGLLDGDLFVVGKWKDRWLQLPETLSVLCVAPPGTGKSTGLVIPSILASDRYSLVVNDVKGELFAITSDHRATVSTVYRFDWGADDGEAGRRSLCWNPLAPGCLPRGASRRDLYIERLVYLLVGDSGDGNLRYFQSRARGLLTGLVHYVIGKAETESNHAIPPQWHGCEASIPMLQDFLGDGLRQLKGAGSQEPVQDLLQHVVDDARALGLSPRIATELTEVIGAADRERASILAVMGESLAIFKNAAVRRRTSSNDIDFSSVRGTPGDGGQPSRPITVYLCVNAEDAAALGRITALFCEALSAYLIANGPGATDSCGTVLGDCGVAFILDEFPQMPRLQALIDGPAVGRGQKVAYLMIAQDFGQIEERYGRPGLEALISTTACKVVFSQNNDQTARRLSQMVGDHTVAVAARNRQFGKIINNHTVHETGIALIRPEEFMSLPEGTQIVLSQRAMSRPIAAATPFYFRERQFRKRVGRGSAGASHADQAIEQ